MSIERYGRPAYTVESGETARAAAERMDKEGAGYLVVVQKGRPVGILTDRELALRILSRRLDPGAILVGELAREPVVTISQAASVAEATALIRRHAIRRLPMVDKRGRLTGIVEADDLLDLVVGELARLRTAVQAQRPDERVGVGTAAETTATSDREE